MTDLAARAAAAGLVRDWEDADGNAQRVPDDVLAAVLDRLDPTPPETPFLSADADTAIDLPADATGAVELHFEDGGRATPKRDARGRLPPLDRPGYHRLLVGDRAYTLALAPRRCPEPPPRSWGAAVQIPALQSREHRAFGDAGALVEAAEAFGRAGAHALAISPTHALFPADPTRFSPYAPSTRLFHNVLLADPGLIGVPLPPPPRRHSSNGRARRASGCSSCAAPMTSPARRRARPRSPSAASAASRSRRTRASTRSTRGSAGAAGRTGRATIRTRPPRR